MPSPPPQPTRSGPAVALMYHAIGEGAAPEGQDPHYTLDCSAFQRQLNFVDAGNGGGSARDWLAGSHGARVLLTFDDGHISNYQYAFPALATRGMGADFFVNPANVGRPGFASWRQLREMSDAGMSIQSHGYDHVYLTSLGTDALRASLRAAREEISQQIGKPVTLLAPPGGRMPRNLCALARECGYTHVLSSRPGLIAAGATGMVLPRMAVTAATGDAELQSWIAGDSTTVVRERLRYAGLALAKRLLGDARYERARARALAALRGTS